MIYSIFLFTFELFCNLFIIQLFLSSASFITSILLKMNISSTCIQIFSIMKKKKNTSKVKIDEYLWDTDFIKVNLTAL